jgi:hypothetical protein
MFNCINTVIDLCCTSALLAAVHALSSAMPLRCLLQTTTAPGEVWMVLHALMDTSMQELILEHGRQLVVTHLHD